MGRQGARTTLPVVAIHLLAAFLQYVVGYVMGFMSLTYSAALLVAAVLLPLVGVRLLALERARAGAAFLIAGFTATAGLGLYTLFGLDFAPAVLRHAGTPWRMLFFGTAMLLPLLQIRGILQAGRILVGAADMELPTWEKDTL